MSDQQNFDATSNLKLDRLIVEQDRRDSLPAHIKYGISGRALMAMEFPDPVYIVDRLITTGLTLLAGCPKGCKSWMALDIAVAVAEDGEALSGVVCDHGSALVLALEDNPCRLKKRLGKMGVSVSSERITFCNKWPTGTEAVKAIEAWAESVPNPKLVIIDVFVCIRPQTGRDVSYQDDYNSLKALQVLANRLDIAVLAVHHTRKAEAEDPLNEVSGTTGLAGAADTILVLKRDNTGTAERRATLLGRGRDLEDDVELALQFDNQTCRWRVLGEARAVANTTEQQQVLDLLCGTPEPMKLKDISDALGKAKSTVHNLLGKLLRDGLVIQPATGFYGVVNTVNSVNGGEQHSPFSPNSPPPDQRTTQTCASCDGEGCEWCREAGR